MICMVRHRSHQRLLEKPELPVPGIEMPEKTHMKRIDMPITLGAMNCT